MALAALTVALPVLVSGSAPAVIPGTVYSGQPLGTIPDRWIPEALGAFVLLGALGWHWRVRQEARRHRLVCLAGQHALQLERSAEERRALIENVAHDLRTPLASLRGHLETAILKEQALSADDRRRYLGIALRQSDCLMRLVDELFDLVRLEEANIGNSREPLQLGELVQDVVQKFGLMARDRQIAVSAPPAPGLPLLTGDINLLERLIDNMLENALRATPPGGLVTVTVAAEARCVRLEISDTGHGIHGNDIVRIFERFQRGDDDQRSAGAGLGLAIVKRIVDLHDGEIAVRSEVGIGTCFSIRFPIQDRDMKLPNPNLLAHSA
ncbi:MAG: HAMP domain-containing sensor histidine kinase [Aliidongia sp.]